MGVRQEKKNMGRYIIFLGQFLDVLVDRIKGFVDISFDDYNFYKQSYDLYKLLL